MSAARGVAVVVVAGVALYAAWPYITGAANEADAPHPETSITDPASWGGYVDDIADAYTDLQNETANSQESQDAMQNLNLDANTRAMLETIKLCEGTKYAGEYQCLYGSTQRDPRLFSSYADHPRIAQRISASDPRWTTAAGAYQFMAVSPIPTGGSTRVDTWDRLKAKLGLPDFSPASQDAAAVELLRECGALDRLAVGDLRGAVSRARRIWASLPGANYAGQGMRSIDQVAAWFAQNGGLEVA